MGMTTVQLTTEGDLYLNEVKTLQVTTDREKVAQDLWVLLRTVKGSYPLSPDFGIDYVDIIESGYIPSNIINKIAPELLKHPDVASVIDIQTARTGERGITVAIKVKLTNNQILSIAGSV